MSDSKDKKAILTRDQFEEKRTDAAKRLATDDQLQKDAFDVLARADQNMVFHQWDWFGEPMLQIPQDIMALQEIIFKTRPDYIIESGVCWGGTVLFYATMMEILGGHGIIGIDVFIPNDLRKRLDEHEILKKRLHLIEGSSVEQSTLEKVKEILKGSKKILVHLDSHHGHNHVLKELQMYSPLVGKGFYLICGDTIVEKIPEQKHRPRPWGPGNNPMTALNEFLKTNDRFEKDQKLLNKILFTCNPEGYLICVKD